MRRNNEYAFESRVRFSEVDHHRRITLPAIINYFQDCSTFQSEELDLGLSFCERRKRAWVLSSWQVEVERYPELGEAIRVRTWASGFQGLYGYRNFCLEDEAGHMAAYAHSVWVYVDTEKGRPVKALPEDIEKYGTGEPLDMEYESRKITLPKQAEEQPSFLVRKYHIDTNEHVNNCQYVQMAMELLPEAEEVFHMRAEYKKSAVYGDRICPKLAVEKDRRVVELCDETGKPYAVVEVKRR